MCHRTSVKVPSFHICKQQVRQMDIPVYRKKNQSGRKRRSVVIVRLHLFHLQRDYCFPRWWWRWAAHFAAHGDARTNCRLHARPSTTFNRISFTKNNNNRCAVAIGSWVLTTYFYFTPNCHSYCGPSEYRHHQTRCVYTDDNHRRTTRRATTKNTELRVSMLFFFTILSEREKMDI